MASLSSSRKVLTRQQRIALASDSGIAAPALTPAERAREKKLRDDPMATVIGPLYVDCKRCGSRIKLSPKSVYDPFHWKTHRERCLRKNPGSLFASAQGPKLNAESKDLSQSDHRDSKQIIPSCSTVCLPLSAVSDSDVSAPVTPPLTPDQDDMHNNHKAAPEDSAVDPHITDQTFSAAENVPFKGYLPTSLRSPVNTTMVPPNCQQWGLSGPKQFDLSEHSVKLVESINDPTMDVRERQLRHDAILSLSLLSQSAPRVS